MRHHNGRTLKFYGYLVAVVLIGTVIAANPKPVLSDPDLTALVGSTFLPRTESADLHSIAHQRVIEIQSDFSHNGATTTEVIAWNTVGMERLVQQWVESPPHNAILSDPTLNLIGCAWDFDGSRYWGVCTLGIGTVQPTVQPAPTPVPAAPAPQPTPTPAGEPREAHGTPNPVAVGSSPTAGASPAPVVMPDTAMGGDSPERTARLRALKRTNPGPSSSP